MTFADNASCPAGAGAGGFGDRRQQAARRVAARATVTRPPSHHVEVPAANLDIFNLGTIFAYQKEFS